MLQPKTAPLPWTASPGLAAWLEEHRVSLAVSGYTSGRLFLVGVREGRVAVDQVPLPGCSGLAWSGRDLVVGSRHALWRFSLGEGEVLRPSRCWLTDHVKAHDLGLQPDGVPVFANTRYSCVARPREGGIGFEILWKPDFISQVVPEDRCHLNGVAVQEGVPRFVTCLARTDVEEGWREHKSGGGCVFEVATGEAVLEGLSMPHSPRLHEGSLWLHESGRGHLVRVDLEASRAEPVASVPGILRGLDFHSGFALAASSQVRYFGRDELPIEVELSRRGEVGECGVCVIDLATGRVLHWLRFERIPELYDVRVLPGLASPSLESVGAVAAGARVAPSPPEGGATDREVNTCIVEGSRHDAYSSCGLDPGAGGPAGLGLGS